MEAKIARLWHPASSPIRLVDVHELICRDTVKLLRSGIEKGWARTKGVDGIHLVTAQRERVDEFWTSDGGMDKWGPLLGFTVCAPHYDPDSPIAAPDLFPGPPTGTPPAGGLPP